MNRLLAILVVLPIVARGAAAEEVIDLPESGYRLTIPDVGWIHVEQRDGAGITTIALGPEGRGGQVQLMIQPVAVADDGIEAVRAQIAELRAAVASDASIRSIGPLELEVADRKAPGLRIEQTGFGIEFRVHLVFLRAGGMQYRIQFHAPSDEFDAQWAIAARVLEGFELVALDGAAVDRSRLMRLAARCGSLVDWAEDWSAASRRARAEGRLVVVAISAVRGFAIGDALREQVFMDDRVVALMRHRFVGFRWSPGMSAPFVDHEVFGLSGTTFGTGLLVCSPAGDVLRQVYLLRPALVGDALAEVLAEHAALAPAPAFAGEDRAGRAAFLIDSGQLDRARALLAVGDDLPFELARLHAIELDGPAALAALRRCAASPATALLEARVHLGLGDPVRAAEALARCLEREPDDAERAEAGVLGGLLDWAGGDVESARRAWTRVTHELPEQPAAWTAAAALLGPALELGVTPDLRWPTAEVRRLARIPAPSALPALDPEQAIVAAADWLVAAQREEGDWESPRGGGAMRPAPDPITMASHAIAITALRRAAGAIGDPDRADACRRAARRALARYLEHRRVDRAHPQPVAFMDYTCWGSAYGLLAMADLLDDDEATDAERAAWRAEADHLVADLARIRQQNGGWSYYLAGQVGAEAAIVAMSFTTATVLLAIDAARSAGIEVPADLTERGSACLASMRGPNGNFAYMRMGVELSAVDAVEPRGAAARGPVCTLALLRTGQLEASALRPAFATFVRHLPRYGDESRKALMHAGPEGQGSHYLLYDYATAAEALRVAGLDDATHRAAREAILRELARCRSADGSFIDNPLIGPVAGSGLAILAMLDLE